MITSLLLYRQMGTQKFRKWSACGPQKAGLGFTHLLTRFDSSTMFLYITFNHSQNWLSLSVHWTFILISKVSFISTNKIVQQLLRRSIYPLKATTNCSTAQHVHTNSLQCFRNIAGIQARLDILPTQLYSGGSRGGPWIPWNPPSKRTWLHSLCHTWAWLQKLCALNPLPIS